jgi:hypothetical protein
MPTVKKNNDITDFTATFYQMKKGRLKMRLARRDAADSAIARQGGATPPGAF